MDEFAIPSLGRLIDSDRSVVVAADVEYEKLAALVKDTCMVKGIGGYKIGFTLGLEKGLPQIVETIQEYTDRPIIYDHQKAATDIPPTGEQFARVLTNSNISAAILFPFGGKKTEESWIKYCQDAGLTVLVGAHMTQPEFLWDEGGFIHPDAPERMFTIAAEHGVTDFVVPGNKTEYVKQYRELFERILGKGNFTLYAPGFITQGGDISAMAQVAGDHWHAIVGGAIYNALNMRESAEKMTAQL